MFGFVCKKFKEGNTLVYNGMRSVLKNVIDDGEAIEWYKLCQEIEKREITIKKFGMDYVYKLPVVGWWGTNVTDEFKIFLRKNVKEKILDDVVVSFWVEILKLYDIVDVAWATVLREKEDIIKHIEEMDMGMLYMKMFIDGFYRFSKIDLEQWGTKVKIDVGFDYTGSEAIEYRYKWEKYKTNIFGVYAPMVWNSMFGDRMDFGWGRVLQKRQLDVLQKIWHITYIAGCRRAGKCVYEEENIRLSDWTYKKAKDVVVWDSLLSSDKVNFTTVNALEKYKKDVLKITLDNGAEFTVSNDHRIPTQHTYEQWQRSLDFNKYKRADELLDGDFIPMALDYEWTWWDINEAKLIWYILWDWCKVKWWWNRISVYSDYIKNKLTAIAKSLWYNITYNKESWNFQILDNCEFKNKYDLNRLSWDKYIPNEVFWWSKENKLWMIQWLIDTGWFIQTTKERLHKDWYIRKDKVVISYTTKSKQLADDVMKIFYDCGIISYIREKFVTYKWEKRLFYNVIITDVNSIKIIIDSCDLLWKKNFERAKDIIKNRSWYKNNTISKIPLCAYKERNVIWKKIQWEQLKFNSVWIPRYDFQRDKCFDYWTEQWLKYSWHKIKKVKSLWEQNVVDIEVDWDHTYWINNVLTHNSYLLSLIAAIAEMWEWFSLQERGRPRRINFFGLTDESNETVVDYILEMSKKFMKDKLFKWNVKSKTLAFYSGWEVLGKVKFFSAESRGKWRGTYADWIILDEAAYMDYEVFRVNLPIVLNQWARMVCISTIDPKTKKNRFYQHLIEAEIAQLDYAPLEDQVMAIWNKYWFDKVKSRKDIKASMLINAKKELMRLRFKIGLRYTIDDVEYMTELERKTAIAEARKQGLDYMYAELYSQFLDERTIFSSEWSVIEEEKLKEINFESIILAYDTASEFDNAAMVAIGINKWMTYILESTILDKDPIKQIEYIKLQRENYTTRIINYMPGTQIPLVVDCTSTPQHILSNIELRWLWVNLPVRYTGGSIAKRDWRFMLIPKELLVNISTEFFKKDAIRISSACTKDKWLLEEMAFFQRKETNTARKDKYEAIQWKDDQVNAMMMALFYAYENEWIKYKFIHDDVDNAERKSFEEFIEMEEEKKKYEKSWLTEVMRKHWF